MSNARASEARHLNWKHAPFFVRRYLTDTLFNCSVTPEHVYADILSATVCASATCASMSLRSQRVANLTMV